MNKIALADEDAAARAAEAWTDGQVLAGAEGLVRMVVESGAECRPGSCFENVKAMVKKHGGSTQHGWAMREQPHFAEGEFYAVWRCLDGRLIDVTPRADGQNKILFLPDSRRVWEGEPVESRRLMLRETPCYCGTGLPFRICHGLADD